MSLVVFSEFPVRNFTHCFTIIQNNGYWIKLDGCYGRITVEVVGEPSADDIRKQGFPCIKFIAGVQRIYAPVQPFTCVSLVKRALGISAPFVLTTLQLHNYLIEKNHA